MKVSAKVRYGLRILLDVALNKTPLRPRTITLPAVIEALQGAVSAVDCVRDTKNCTRTPHGIAHSFA